MNDVTQILSQVERGDPEAAERLLPLIYEELRKLAAAKMAAERPDHTLQPTALIHEAYIRLVGAGNGERWNGRAHFFGAAAEAMRRILVDHARSRQSKKHGGQYQKVPLDLAAPILEHEPDDLLALDEALDRLAEVDSEVAELAKLRLFSGLSNSEAAIALGLAESTAKKHWLYARAWIRRMLAEMEPGQNS